VPHGRRTTPGGVGRWADGRVGRGSSMTWSVSVQWMVSNREKGRRIDLGESRRECARKARRNDRGECRRGDCGAFPGFAGAPVVAPSSPGTRHRSGHRVDDARAPRDGARAGPALPGSAERGSAEHVDVERGVVGTEPPWLTAAGPAQPVASGQPRPGGLAVVAGRTAVLPHRTAGHEQRNSRRQRWRRSDEQGPEERVRPSRSRSGPPEREVRGQEPRTGPVVPRTARFGVWMMIMSAPFR
jgi:hypothetical protein